ncbi:HAD hydrolase-like protein [candidate division CSSED10-310 bacterium]|uniref:HAD hydrolase-like protein n=1 Tax=candidate division CSSED10-310 bacterium TaxID=2855610 RepID=A0ABV6Z235_UNCC1
MVRAKKILILDLDNTLYDWITYYARSFRAMLTVLERLSGVKEEILIAEFKAIHQKHHSSEYAFSIQELPSLQKRHPQKTPAELITYYWEAVVQFRRTREKCLKLYPGVRDTIQKLHQAGVRITGHSDAMEYYAVRRLQRLGLANYFDCLYVAREHALPSYLHPQKIDHQKEQRYNPPVRSLSVDQHKPNPSILRRILADFSMQPTEAVLVGDSLKRDVYMAQTVGVYAVWAHYGTYFSADDFSLLVAITHWTEQDIQRELHVSEDVKPSLTIEHFSEIERLFED